LQNSTSASRYYNRWVSANPLRKGMIERLSAAPIQQAQFAQLLQAELALSSTPEQALPGAMRRLRNLVVTNLIERDLSGKADLAEVVLTMSDFADFALRTHLDALMTELTAQHGTPIGERSGTAQHMIVLGMGKLGGQELNVSSDIDLIFIFPENGETNAELPDQRRISNQEFFTKLGKKLIGALSEITEDGFTFRVDMALRPNGNSGPLVASLNMVEDYLIYQGREWERYAWIKARAITGQAKDIATLHAISTPFIYRRYLDFGSIDALRSMHGQIRAEVKRQETMHPDRSNNVKLGRGGIREVEFISQVFQLIRGGRELQLRNRSTRETLRIIAELELLQGDVVDHLLDAYTFLRDLEHRLQYLDDAQTHTLPTNPDDVATVAAMMGYADTPQLLAKLEEHRNIVAQQFDAIFQEKQPAQGKETSGNSASVSVSDDLEALTDALTALAFVPAAEGARRLHSTLQSQRIQNLPDNSRQKLMSLINTALSTIVQMPADHLMTLGRLLDFLEAVARRAAYLALLTEYPHTLKRLIRMVAASDWAAKYLTQHPILLDELLDTAALKSPPNWQEFKEECTRQLTQAHEDTERQMDILRELHHAQLFRLLAQDLEGDLSVERLADYLSELTDILVDVTITSAWQTIANRHREMPQFAVIAYGKLGGKELSYASDLDVVFLYDDDDQEAPALYAKLAQRFITWMTSHTSAGILFDIDVALRPDGASGLMVTSFNTFEKYQRNSAWLWEHQALTRARYCAGDASIGARFETLRTDVLRQKRDPHKLKEEVISMRLKMREANPNRSELFDLKYDTGGMIDIEFIVQYLVLCYAHEFEALTADIGNIALLKLCGELHLIDTTLANNAANAYRTLRKLQHQTRLQGAERARVQADLLKTERSAVIALWDATFA
jgi:glutamate-ammonia-ligase adenylyltransferase